MKNGHPILRLHRRTSSGPVASAGFTLLELLVVMGVILALAVITFGNFKQTMVRAKLQGDAAALSNAIQRARTAALRLSKTVVGEIDTDTDELVFFYDEDDDIEYTEGTDEVISTIGLTGGNSPEVQVHFWDFADGSPDPDKAMDGFTTRSGLNPVLVIDSDGSVRDLGGIRIGMGAIPHDKYDANFMEVRVVIAATGRTQLRKYVPDATTPAYQPKFQTADGPNWKFY